MTISKPSPFRCYRGGHSMIETAQKAALVAVVNQTFVETFFPQNEAVGKRLQNEGQSTLIVGVAGT